MMGPSAGRIGRETLPTTIVRRSYDDRGWVVDRTTTVALCSGWVASVDCDCARRELLVPVQPFCLCPCSPAFCPPRHPFLAPLPSLCGGCAVPNMSSPQRAPRRAPQRAPSKGERLEEGNGRVHLGRTDVVHRMDESHLRRIASIASTATAGQSLQRKRTPADGGVATWRGTFSSPWRS